MDWNGLISRLRISDWSIVVLVLGFLVAAPIYAPVRGFTSGLAEIDRYFEVSDFTRYSDAIAAAALKRPTFKRQLAAVDREAAAVRVASFGAPLGRNTTSKYVWVALEQELKDACKGADDPVLALQQILGLPPAAGGSSVVNTFSVPGSPLFRPCISDSTVEATSCDFKVPDEAAQSLAPAELREEYERLHFLARQMWQSYQLDFRRPTESRDDYPMYGAPFTGMGWTYNWGNPPYHMGVSEFIVKRRTDLEDSVVSTSPARFCS